MAITRWWGSRLRRRRTANPYPTCGWCYFGVGATPVRARKAETALAGSSIDDAAAALDLDPTGDIQATADVKKHLAGVLLRRVAKQLMGDAGVSTLDIRLTVNGESVAETVEPRITWSIPAREPGSDRQSCRLRAWGMRRLYGARSTA